MDWSENTEGTTEVSYDSKNTHTNANNVQSVQRITEVHQKDKGSSLREIPLAKSEATWI